MFLGGFQPHQIQCLFFFLIIYLFLFMAVLGLRFCARASSSHGKRGPLFIAVRGPLTTVAPPAAEYRLQMRRLSNCGSRAQTLRGMWDLPGPGVEPVSPALAGRFSTNAPPGKPQCLFFFFLAAPWSLRDLSSLTRDRTRGMAVKALGPNHWTAREFPTVSPLFKKNYKNFNSAPNNPEIISKIK